MKHWRFTVSLTLVSVCLALPAAAQGIMGRIGKGAELAKKGDDLHFSEEEEQELGRQVSEKLRTRFGVVQDAGAHRYVTLVGTVLAQASSRPNLPWTFIILDTDAVNAFAAPGGYVHVTKGALAMLTSEAQLAGVLGHEIIHISEKHTLGALRNAAGMNVAASASGKDGMVSSLVADKMYSILTTGYGRKEEHESDQKGVVLANKVGYAPQGIPQFLTALMARNTGGEEKRGLFASHPDTKERIAKLEKQIAKDKLTSAAVLDARYKKNISFKPVAITEIAVVESGAAGFTGGGKAAPPAKKDANAKDSKDAKATESANAEDGKKKKGWGLGAMKGFGGGEKQQAQATGSGGARGIDPEVDAKGGGNPKVVAVNVTPKDIDAFKKEGKLS